MYQSCLHSEEQSPIQELVSEFQWYVLEVYRGWQSELLAQGVYNADTGQ